MKLSKLLFFILISLLIISCSGVGWRQRQNKHSHCNTCLDSDNAGKSRHTFRNQPNNSLPPAHIQTARQQDITTSVTWSSSDTTVATISNTAGSNGLVTSLATGTTTITALSGSISGSTLLTVQDDNNDNVLTVTVNGGCGTRRLSQQTLRQRYDLFSRQHQNCQTIDNILLDTGASGLRIFKSVLTSLPTQATSGSGSLTECIQYADNSADWGPVQLADIILGNEPAVTVPIQIIDSTFGNTSCSQTASTTSDTSPSIAGYNGILGIGLFTQDCGSQCTSIANNGMYYSCNGSSCTATAVSLNNQVQNPVSLLPLDNNGVIVQLPSIPPGGATLG